MISRHDLVVKVLELLPRADLRPDKAMRIWFWDIRPGGGFRLTLKGLQDFQQAGLNHWQQDFDTKTVSKRLLIDMSKKISWPYYIDTKNQKLVFFNSRDAVTAQIYGDVELWLNAL